MFRNFTGKSQFQSPTSILFFLSFVFFSLFLLLKTVKVCIQKGCKAIHSEYLWVAPAGIAAGKLLRRSTVVSLHNVEYLARQREKNLLSVNHSRLGLGVLYLVERFVCNNSDRLVVTSEIDKAYFHSLGIDRKIIVIPNGVDTSLFHPNIDGSEVRKSYGLEYKKIILFHGALKYAPNQRAVKDIVEFILPSLINCMNNVFFLVVGSNPPEIRRESLIFTGKVKELHKFIATANIGIIPLKSGSGTRLKILEYLACGKPVVSTKIGAEGLQVEHERELILIDDVNQDFINWIIKILNNDRLASKLSLFGRKKAEDYDWFKVLRNYEQIYSSIIREKEEY